MEFKDKVIYLRAKLNLSQTKLGKMLDVSLITISRWENGKALPSKKDMIRFEELCKLNEVYFNE